MKKVIFVCSAGMSTSMLVEKTKEAAKKEGYDLELNAYSEAEAKGLIAKGGLDAIFLGPQVRFLLAGMKKVAGTIPVEVIEAVSYGRMDGAAVLAQIKKLVDK